MQEVDKFSEAFKNPEFIKLFEEYAKEVSDPKVRNWDAGLNVLLGTWLCIHYARSVAIRCVYHPVLGRVLLSQGVSAFILSPSPSSSLGQSSPYFFGILVGRDTLLKGFAANDTGIRLLGTQIQTLGESLYLYCQYPTLGSQYGAGLAASKHSACRHLNPINPVRLAQWCPLMLSAMPPSKCCYIDPADVTSYAEAASSQLCLVEGVGAAALVEVRSHWLELWARMGTTDFLLQPPSLSRPAERLQTAPAAHIRLHVVLVILIGAGVVSHVGRDAIVPRPRWLCSMHYSMLTPAPPCAVPQYLIRCKPGHACSAPRCTHICATVLCLAVLHPSVLCLCKSGPSGWAGLRLQVKRDRPTPRHN